MNKRVKELFVKHEDEYLRFARVKNKRSNRPDLQAFLLIDELFPSSKDIVSASKYEEIFIDITYDQIESLTEDHIIELIRCGVMYTSDGSFMMYT